MTAIHQPQEHPSPASVSYLHPLDADPQPLPSAFTFPFRYTPHPLCRQAALLVQQRLEEMNATSGKMYGVLIVTTHEHAALHPAPLYFMAAYSGQLSGSYDHPWFVPPVVDYLSPESHFQQEQARIVAINRQIDQLKDDPERAEVLARVSRLSAEREAAVAQAKAIYEAGRLGASQVADREAYIRTRQHQKADIHRARQLHKEELVELMAWLTRHHASVRQLQEERKQRSEDLQQWLFRQFDFLNAKGQHKNLVDLFLTGEHRLIPSGAGECCAPKLLQAAYRLGLKPVAMAEFWWGSSSPDHYREPGAFFPACRSKCFPILGHMLQGLDVEPDPAGHYDSRVLAPVRVVWEDEHIAVVMKPEGWVSIPGRSDQPCLMDECIRRFPDITGSVIVHRLDQDTSGLLVIARNAKAHRALCRQFEERQVSKRYVALLEMGPADASRFAVGQTGVINLPIGPDLEDMPRRRVDMATGREAVTRYEVTGVEPVPTAYAQAMTAASPQLVVVARVVFWPETGRTHQLRVHSAAPAGLGAPILGDRLYGHVGNRLYLHAEALEFMHPVTGEVLHFEFPAPF